MVKEIQRMSYDADSVDRLTEMYENQSPSAFIAYSMAGLPESEHAERYDKGDHDGLSKCDYGCCSDRGICKGAKWHICIGGCVICCCACCCYVTEGFNGVWTYWPF